MSAVEHNLSIGTSNIIPATLPFDMHAFRTLKHLRLDGIPPENVRDASAVRGTLTRLAVCGSCATQINQIVLCDCVHRNMNEMAASNRWPNLEVADFSNNQLCSIDASIRLLPKLRHLSLDRNRIVGISNLSSLPFLETLSLRENRIADLSDCHLELGNIKVLNLSMNQLASLDAFRKMYSLTTLNVSCNRIEAIDAVDAIAGLPCLEELVLTGNPVAGAVGKCI